MIVTEVGVKVSLTFVYIEDIILGRCHTYVYVMLLGWSRSWPGNISFQTCAAWFASESAGSSYWADGWYSQLHAKHARAEFAYRTKSWWHRDTSEGTWANAAIT